MPEFSPMEMSPEDRQVGTMFGAVGRVVKNPDAPGPGYRYPYSAARPIGFAARRLQVEHGLSIQEVFRRLVIASELAVKVQEHVGPQLPEDSIDRLN